jgi:hypothetical protein
MPRCLLYNANETIEGVNEKEFYGARYETALKNNNPYVGIEGKIFKTYKLIEVIDETHAVEHFRYVFPFYNNNY